MIVNEIAKFWKPLQLAAQLLLVAELGEALLVTVLLARRLFCHGHAGSPPIEKVWSPIL